MKPVQNGTGFILCSFPVAVMYGPAPLNKRATRAVDKKYLCLSFDI